MDAFVREQARSWCRSLHSEEVISKFQQETGTDYPGKY